MLSPFAVGTWCWCRRSASPVRVIEGVARPVPVRLLLADEEQRAQRELAARETLLAEVSALVLLHVEPRHA